MRGRGRVRGDATRIAQIRSYQNHLKSIHKAFGLLITTFQNKGNNPAALLHLSFSQLILRVRGQMRISYGFDLLLVFQEPGNRQRAAAVAVHPQRKRFQTFGKYPGIEWRPGRTSMPDKEHHLIDQVSAPHYYAPEHASLAVHVFGGRMTYQIKTIGNRLLQIGRGEAIIYVENN